VLVLQIGLFSALPYVFMGTFSLLSGLVADYLNTQRITTLTVIRKLFTSTGQFIDFIHRELMTNTSVLAKKLCRTSNSH